MSNVYVSTSCLKNPKNVVKVLEEYSLAGIQNVELGSVHSFFNVKELKNFKFNFLIHNYFPPPKKPFIFNLASSNEFVRSNSIKLAKKAILLCYKVNSPLYTFHAGFTLDPPKLGQPFPKKKFGSRETHIKLFIDSVGKIVDFAKKYGIKLAMEPNVVQKFNLINGKNEMLLFADFNEIKTILKKFNKKELGLLLDLGHTAVTSHWLNYDKDNFVSNCKDRVLAVHISNNNGIQDQHRSLTSRCWQISKLRYFHNIPIILETMNLSTNEIKRNIDLVERELES